MKALITAAALAGVLPASAGTLHCSEWNGIRTCTGPDGYRARESTWNGITTGEDNRGTTWRKTEWQGNETIDVRRHK